MEAFLYEAGGTVTPQRPGGANVRNGAILFQFNLRELQGYVNGPIEVLDLDDNYADQSRKLGLRPGTVLVLHENQKNKPINGKITAIMRYPVYGDVLLSDGRLVPRSIEADQIRENIPRGMLPSIMRRDKMQLECPNCKKIMFRDLKNFSELLL
jgi:hypothetical protein